MKQAATQTGAATPEPPRISFGRMPTLLGYNLRRAHVALFKHFAQTVTAAENITAGRLGVLQIIAANPDLTQSRLAEAMEVDRSAIVKVIDQLENHNLIVRQPSAHDRRSHRLRLTETGRFALRRMEALARRHEKEFTRVLTEEELKTLIRLLERLYTQPEPPLVTADQK